MLPEKWKPCFPWAEVKNSHFSCRCCLLLLSPICAYFATPSSSNDSLYHSTAGTTNDDEGRGSMEERSGGRGNPFSLHIHFASEQPLLTACTTLSSRRDNLCDDDDLPPVPPPLCCCKQVAFCFYTRNSRLGSNKLGRSRCSKTLIDTVVLPRSLTGSISLFGGEPESVIY